MQLMSGRAGAGAQRCQAPGVHQEGETSKNGPELAPAPFGVTPACFRAGPITPVE